MGLFSGFFDSIKDVAKDVVGAGKDVWDFGRENLSEVFPTIFNEDVLQLAGMAGGAMLAGPALGFGGGAAGGGAAFGANSLVPGAGGGPGIWEILMGGKGGAAGAGGPWSTAFALGSGLMGMNESRKMRQTAERAAEMQDPFRGERERYQAELRQLYDDPSRVERLPGYKAGINAVERKMASQGYLGSGNMMLALHDYGGRAFDSEAQRLAVLAGGTSAPGGGSQLVEGNKASSDLMSRSLASMGYGVRGLERLWQ